MPNKIPREELKEGIRKVLEVAGKDYVKVKEYERIREEEFGGEVPHPSTITYNLGGWKSALEKARGVYQKKMNQKRKEIEDRAKSKSKEPRTPRKKKILKKCPRERCVWKTRGDSCMFPRCVVLNGWSEEEE